VGGQAPLYEGRSLWPLVRGTSDAWPTRPVFAQRRPVDDPEAEDQAEVFALQTAQQKLIRHIPGGDEFYDLERDPKELVDLGSDHDAATGLRAALEERLRLYRGPISSDANEVPPEWLQELKDLGY